MKTSLVIMAAGLGSRYGGNKQVAGIGPNGEMLMEYSIYDAVRAGFERIVLIIKPDMKELMDGICGHLNKMTTKSGAPLEVVYAFQDFSSIPEFYTIPEERTKPFGTVHALLCAEEYIDGPCCVINADDYYGVDAYNTIYQSLEGLQSEGQAVMVGYLLKNTASLNGTVSRGVCKVKDGKLESIKETKNIQLYDDGSIIDLTENQRLDSNSVVSMNYWGFMPSIFPAMEEYFEIFEA